MNRAYLSHYIRLFLTQFLPHEKGLSENTILAYRDSMKLLLLYCTDHLKLRVDDLHCDAMDEPCITRFLNWLEAERKCSASTRNSRLAALKTFFKYLARHVPECVDESRKILAIPKKKTPHKPAEYLEQSELQSILNSIDTASVNGLRDKALLLFMYNTGARVQEVVDVTIGDLRLDAAAQVKLTGKGKRQRVCPLWQETVDAIKEYLSQKTKAQTGTDDTLFQNARKSSLTRFGVGYILNKYTTKALGTQPILKCKRVSPHTIRHTTAMHLLQAGNELNMVRLWLGHASLNTTHMYIDIDMVKKREILEKSRPPALVENEEKWDQPEILKWLDSFVDEPPLCGVVQGESM
jgi:site-specific recombinase XerD